MTQALERSPDPKGPTPEGPRRRRPMPQRLPKVSSPQDASEVEADRVASRIVVGGSAGPITPLPVGGSGRVGDPGRVTVGEEPDTIHAWLQRVAVGEEREDDLVPRVAVGDQDETLQRAAGGTAGGAARGPTGGSGARATGGGTMRTITNPTGGSPLVPAVRSRIEPGLGVGLDGVRVHADAAATAAASALQARAFTYGGDIFLGRGESPTDLALMAHEAVHVVQQGAADGAPQVQRLAGFIRDELADVARHVPGYTFFTVVIGYDPIRGSDVARTARALIQGFMELVPLGALIFDALDDLGLIDDLLGFLDAKLSEHDLSLARLERTVEDAWDRMDFLRLDPFDYNLGVLEDEFGDLWDDVVAFAANIVDGLIQLVKDAAIDLVVGLVDDQPVWRLFTKVIGRDPLRDEPVEATTEEIIADFLILIGRETELEQMRERGTLAATAAWIDTQLATFHALIDRIGALLTAAWEAIQPSNLGNIIGDLEALAVGAVDLLGDISAFAWTVATKVLELIKDALLGWLSDFVHEVPGFHLVTVIIGRDPFTGQPVPRTAENLMRGFITLIPGGNAVYERLVETGVVPQAAATIEGAVEELGISWEMVTGLFLGIWNSLSIDELVDPIGAFTRIRDQFGEPIGRLFAFIRVVLQEVLNLLLAMMHFPVDLIGSIVSNAMAAFADIRRDFIGFLLNMLEAVKQGFAAFFGNVADHLIGGVVEWLFRGLRDAGIEPPTDLSFSAILDVVLQLLNLTLENLWAKLADRIGQERVDQIRGVLDRLSGVWTFVRDVQERGITAIWEYIQQQLSGLWELVLGKARDWIVEVIITRVTARLLSMLDPTGIMAVINGFIAFFDAVQSAIEYFTEILQIINQWVSTIGAIAKGEVQAGAVILEEALADAIPVAIGFLAQQVGLSNIGERLAEIVEGVRSLVDRALTWLLDQAMAVFNALLGALGFGAAAEGGEDVPPADVTVDEDFKTQGVDHSLQNEPGSARLVMKSTPMFLDQHPDETVRKRYAEYLAVVRDVEVAPSTRKRLINDKVRELIATLKSAGATDAPGASAPGIGAIDRHGAQQTRLQRSGFRVWWLESEHVVPRGFINAAFEAMRERGVAMRSADYRQMTTILIYERAADRKTGGKDGDASLIASFKGLMEEVAEVWATSNKTIGDAAAVVHGIRALLDRFAEDAYTRTMDAIESENEEFGEKRGPEGSPEPPLPPGGRVRIAYERQLLDAERQLQERMNSAVT